MHYDRVDVSGWRIIEEESVGASEKIWLRDPSDTRTVGPEGLWLFKPVTVHANGFRQTGDWSEAVVSQLAKRLEIPSAPIRLGERNGRPGTLSENVRPGELWEMHTGALWLHDHPDSDFGPRPSTARNRPTPGHTLVNIQLGLEGLMGPPQAGESASNLSAFDFFAGYLLLDAFVGNRDRHEQNWSILKHSLGRESPRLAALYDNEGCLGFNFDDENRQKKLSNPAKMERFRRGATAWRLDWGDRDAPTLTDAALTACSMASDEARSFWHARFDAMDLSAIQSILNSVPGMSDVGRSFASELLTTNLEGICHGLDN